MVFSTIPPRTSANAKLYKFTIVFIDRRNRFSFIVIIKHCKRKMCPCKLKSVTVYLVVLGIKHV